jgi:aryl-alcohol dehydrogenase-like predicted oxidoreductase
VTAGGRGPRLSGQATAAGTARFRQRFAHLDAGFFTRALGLDLSSIGLGTYLGEADADTDRAYGQAIRLAPTLGCNLIDTAVNYRCQFSERVIGSALRDLVSSGVLHRDEVVVCTKGGYLSFDGPPTDAKAWVRETFIDPGIIDWSDIVAHNVMHAGYIRHQINTSLTNLGLETIDVYYLHNPESQLQGVPRPECLARITACFQELERAVGEGRIGVYGVATWDAFRVDSSSRGSLSMDELVTAARAAGGDAHHFRVVQLPFNLGMPEAFAKPTQHVGQDRMPAFEAASRLGLTAFASGSLLQGRLTALPPDLAALIPGAATDVQRSLQFVRSTPGVAAALVGMKTAAHVRDNLALGGCPRLSADRVAALFQ